MSSSTHPDLCNNYFPFFFIVLSPMYVCLCKQQNLVSSVFELYMNTVILSSLCVYFTVCVCVCVCVHTHAHGRTKI